MLNIIIEGMDPDNTKLQYVARQANIPNNITTIDLWTNSLTLVGRLSASGCETVNTEEKLELKLNYVPIGAPSSPQALLVEDGRIYAWTEGLEDQRLQTTLKYLKSAGGFDPAYKQIIQQPEKFYNVAGCCSAEQKVLEPVP